MTSNAQICLQTSKEKALTLRRNTSGLVLSYVSSPNVVDLNIRQQSAASLYRTNVIMFPWGDDFRFVAAERQFTNMDLLINYVNSHPDFNVRVQYSTLSRYFAALQRTKVEFPSYVGDFFPYADLESGYWTVSSDLSHWLEYY